MSLHEFDGGARAHRARSDLPARRRERGGETIFVVAAAAEAAAEPVVGVLRGVSSRAQRFSPRLEFPPRRDGSSRGRLEPRDLRLEPRLALRGGGDDATRLFPRGGERRRRAFRLGLRRLRASPRRRRLHRFAPFEEFLRASNLAFVLDPRVGGGARRLRLGLLHALLRRLPRAFRLRPEFRVASLRRLRRAIRLRLGLLDAFLRRLRRDVRAFLRRATLGDEFSLRRLRRLGARPFRRLGAHLRNLRRGDLPVERGVRFCRAFARLRRLGFRRRGFLPRRLRLFQRARRLRRRHLLIHRRRAFGVLAATLRRERRLPGRLRRRLRVLQLRARPRQRAFRLLRRLLGGGGARLGVPRRLLGGVDARFQIKVGRLDAIARLRRDPRAFVRLVSFAPGRLRGGDGGVRGGRGAIRHLAFLAKIRLRRGGEVSRARFGFSRRRLRRLRLRRRASPRRLRLLRATRQFVPQRLRGGERGARGVAFALGGDARRRLRRGFSSRRALGALGGDDPRRRVRLRLARRRVRLGRSVQRARATRLGRLGAFLGGGGVATRGAKLRLERGHLAKRRR